MRLILQGTIGGKKLGVGQVVPTILLLVQKSTKKVKILDQRISKLCVIRLTTIYLASLVQWYMEKAGGVQKRKKGTNL